jgi:alginate O-acetyltransferase complex protein AlgI
MVFSSALFLIFFLPLFLAAYFLLPRQMKNIWLLIASIAFYAWGAPDFILIVVGSLAADFYLVRYIPGSTRLEKRILAGVSISLNIGLLAYFKYANFFIENLNVVLGQMGLSPAQWAAIALPIGISFFTFQKITYTVDVYRGVHGPLGKLTDYMMYILNSRKPAGGILPLCYRTL